MRARACQAEKVVGKTKLEPKRLWGGEVKEAESRRGAGRAFQQEWTVTPQVRSTEDERGKPRKRQFRFGAKRCLGLQHCDGKGRIPGGLRQSTAKSPLNAGTSSTKELCFLPSCSTPSPHQQYRPLNGPVPPSRGTESCRSSNAVLKYGLSCPA